ncbi:MAG: hypothetical protein BGN88_13655 [Clostridiales bacterium 43-6]|nr:MAG: hypothetical protein BGN88_13655 [Clostridiales bacterium 43-6]
MENLKKTVSENIIYLRTQNKMTQYELGQQLNYSDKAVSKWERAESIPDAYILKRMSELFGVTVDYLLNDHEDRDAPPMELIHHNGRVITKMSFVGVWGLAMLAFTVLWAVGYVEWLVFVYTLPISLIVLLVLNSVWGKRKRNFYILSALLWSVIAAIYVTFLHYNWWLIFVLGIPSEIILSLSFKIKRKTK